MAHGHGWRISVTIMIMASSCVTALMAEFDFLVSFLQVYGLQKCRFALFDGPWTDYQCHSETTINQPNYQLEVQLLGLGPCSFPSICLDLEVQYEVLLSVLLIMTTV